MLWDHFDWGGFLGAVFGAIAAGLGVIYSLNKTSEFDRRKDELKKNSIKKIIISEAKLSFSNVYHTTIGLMLASPPNSSSYKWWKQIEPQMYLLYPAAISANLTNIDVLIDKEIESTLSLNQNMAEYSQSLEKCKSVQSEEEFSICFPQFLWRRQNIISSLKDFFRTVAPSEKMGDDLVLNGIDKLEGSLPDHWKPVSLTRHTK